MKQIDFNANLINTPGISVKYRNGEVPDFVKKYRNGIFTINDDGQAFSHTLDGRFSRDGANENDLLLYSSTRGATEIAKATYNLLFDGTWNRLDDKAKNLCVACVRAGIDEMKNGGE